MLFDQNTVGVCIIRDGEKYLLANADHFPSIHLSVDYLSYYQISISSHPYLFFIEILTDLYNIPI